MATLSYSWTFAVDAESWAAVSNCTVGHLGAILGSPDGMLAQTLTGTPGARVTGTAGLSTTWEALGIPSGATVTAIVSTLVTAQGRLEGYTGTPWDVALALTGTGTLATHAFAANLTWESFTNAAALPVAAASRPSDSALDFTLTLTAPATLLMLVEIITVEITYTEAVPEVPTGYPDTLVTVPAESYVSIVPAESHTLTVAAESRRVEVIRK